MQDLQSFALPYCIISMKNLYRIALIAASLSPAHAEDRDMLRSLDLWLCETEVATGFFWNSEEWVAVDREINIDDVRWLLRVPDFKSAYVFTEEAQRFGIVEDYRSRVAYLTYEDCDIDTDFYDGALRKVSCSDRWGNAFYFSTNNNRFLNAGDLDMPTNRYIDENTRRLGPHLTVGTCEKLTP